MDSRLDNYVCYACNHNFAKLPGDCEDVTCPLCRSEFVERLEDEEDPVTQMPAMGSALAEPAATRLQVPQSSKTEEDVDSQGNEFQSCKGSEGPESQRNNKGESNQKYQEEQK